MTSKTLGCSFCGKSQYEVSKLIAGPGVAICDACLALSNKITANDFSAPVLTINQAQQIKDQLLAAVCVESHLLPVVRVDCIALAFLRIDALTVKSTGEGA